MVIKYRQFYELCEELIAQGKRFDQESLKLLSFKDIDLACIGNAGKAACNCRLAETEKKRRVDIILNMSFDDVENDKGKWKILDDMSIYYAYYRAVAEKLMPAGISKLLAPKWKLLVEEMMNLRGNWSNGRDNNHLKRIYELLLLVEAEGIVPLGWCQAVKMNADTFDGEFNDGRIMRDGAMRLPEQVARVFGFPSTDASGNVAKLMGARPVKRECGYRGSYEELFEDILTPEQKIIYVSKFIEKDDDDDDY